MAFYSILLDQINLNNMSILIKDTTPMERIAIVKDALEGEYDEFYDDYVDGKKELAELNREYSEKYAGSGTDEVLTSF